MEIGLVGLSRFNVGIANTASLAMVNAPNVENRGEERSDTGTCQCVHESGTGLRGLWGLWRWPHVVTRAPLAGLRLRNPLRLQSSASNALNAADKRAIIANFGHIDLVAATPGISRHSLCYSPESRNWISQATQLKPSPTGIALSPPLSPSTSSFLGLTTWKYGRGHSGDEFSFNIGGV